jgi:hypothetical protein
VNKIVYFERVSGRKPILDWIRKQDKPVRVNIYGKLEDLSREGLGLLDTKAMDIIHGQDKGLYELRSISLNWRIGTYYSKVKDTFILLHGWHHDESHEQEHQKDIQKTRDYLHEYLQMENLTR